MNELKPIILDAYQLAGNTYLMSIVSNPEKIQSFIRIIN